MRYALAIHGGAGLIRPGSLSAEREDACRGGLERALSAGEVVLKAGGSAMDAVIAATLVLEDDPHFNAGRGSVLAADGSVELDAALMEGTTRRAGAVAGARTPRNPILLARAVLEHTPHVLMVGAGADALAAEFGVPTAPPEYFIVPERVAQLQAGMGAPTEKDVYGTVGAVACDQAGRLAVATSTGGMTGKRVGRAGDTPVIGAGTFAWDRTCAVSGTGHGEPYIRLGVAHRVSAWMDIGGMQLDTAAERVIFEELPDLAGQGGLIGVDRLGNVTMPFNTAGMFRGSVQAGGERVVAIWRDA